MSKKPVQKQKQSKQRTRTRHSAYVTDEVIRLRERQNSPYAVPAEPKNKADKALKGITRIKA